VDKKRIIIFADHSRADRLPVLKRLLPPIEKLADVTSIDLADELPTLQPKSADLGIVLGGDGTILGVGRVMCDVNLPLLGVNLGKLGYMASFSPDQLLETLPTILAGKMTISRRMILDCRLDDCDGQSRSSRAVNDVVVQAGPPYRMIDLAVHVENEELTVFSGDGLIVSTATGSTAHNVSAGGPIVDAELAAIVLTPICAHSLTHRPLVLADNQRITVTAGRANQGSSVIIDGQIVWPLRAGDRLTACKYDRRFLLVENPKYNRWHALQTKLNWGLRPNYLGS